MKSIVTLPQIEKTIFVIRGHKVMLDTHLAHLYKVPTKALNQAVRRNLERFPFGFMFRLTKEEFLEVVTNCDHLKTLKFSHQYPLAFTEYGVAMLSSVLRSKQAIRVNIKIIQTFIRLKTIVDSNKVLSSKIEMLEKKYGYHDNQIKEIFSVLHELIDPPQKPKKHIGFQHG